METNNITDSWEPKLNLTETDEDTATVNATVRSGAGNETALTEEEEDGGEGGGGQDGEDMTPRIVGGMLEKPGGSPWQVQKQNLQWNPSSKPEGDSVSLCSGFDPQVRWLRVLWGDSGL